ncbi:ChrR family anti-sigma-E factor [Thaumasiovibrio sp. DFM-14]|uniref:ChrR family anti-sigma-E factor n=1 Tax=Thaumasiovibrio sp. DFM-14 TaxID=3384792 RepID=UPI0039A07EB6
MTNYHPNDHTLEAWASGQLSPADAFAVALHIDMCPHCLSRAKATEEIIAEQYFSPSSMAWSQTPVKTASEFTTPMLSSNDDELLAEILDLPQLSSTPKTDQPDIPSYATVSVSGTEFCLPKRLNAVLPQLKHWKDYGQRVFTASLFLEDSVQMSLLYIKKGVQVPEHTHKGTETTLVLHGCFEDENGLYQHGDYLSADNSTTHTPRTVDSDCLCLTVLSQPMLFTQGVAKVFNRFGKGMYP